MEFGAGNDDGVSSSILTGDNVGLELAVVVGDDVVVLMRGGGGIDSRSSSSRPYFGGLSLLDLS